MDLLLIHSLRVPAAGQLMDPEVRQVVEPVLVAGRLVALEVGPVAPEGQAVPVVRVVEPEARQVVELAQVLAAPEADRRAGLALATRVVARTVAPQMSQMEPPRMGPSPMKQLMSSILNSHPASST